MPLNDQHGFVDVADTESDMQNGRNGHGAERAQTNGVQKNGVKENDHSFQNGHSNGVDLTPPVDLKAVQNGLEVKLVKSNGVNGSENRDRLQNGDGISTKAGEVQNSVKLDEKGYDTRKRDEYEVDFSDTRSFTVSRWVDILKNATAKLTDEDMEMAEKFHEWEVLAKEIQARLNDPTSTQLMKRQMGKIQSLPHVLATLARSFSKLVSPLEVRFELLWGLVYINLKLSYASPDRLRRTSDLLSKIRRVTELFNRCLDNCEERNEAGIAVVDFLDPITIILTDSIIYFHECSSDKDAEQAWPDLNESINQQLSTLDSTVKHVNDITSYSKVNLDRKIKNMSLRHALIPENEEPGTFPNKLLPFKFNPRFYGRKNELDKIIKYLSPKEDQSLRTYTIYGRRGVGKTEIALQFAHTNPCGYDALFWIQCETSVAIRESFTKVAVSLNLPGADRDGHHEENLLAVHQWLKKTKKRWLMIFDNAEKDQILRPYWPIGSSGAILITSRTYFNFSKDMLRRGDTIKPFSPKESWDLLLQLLGDDWKRDDREGRIPASEVTAATNMLEKLEGLALAIQQAAILIKDPEIGGPTIAKTYEMFKERNRTLPERHRSSRSSSVRALDALWDMIFKSLSKNARALIGVLAWLSPDSIPIQLFQPRNQAALEGVLSFCMQESIHLDDHYQASLASLTTPSKELEQALQELMHRELIKQDGLTFSIHRVVQEAVNYSDVDELQESFDIASRLVYEQFPEPEMNGALYNQWSICQEYIPHGVYLSKKFSDYVRSGNLKGTEAFVKLLCNSAWYLYEVGDYDASNRVLETGVSACDDKTSLVYAELRNIAGSRFNNLNRLADCRRAWEETMQIRKALLPHDSPGIAAIYNNLGNLELAAGNVEESEEYFEKAMQIWGVGGDKAAANLALTYLCFGRVQMLKGDLTEAMARTTLSESLFKRVMGADRGFMANVHFAYGNIHFLQKHYTLAWRSYDACLKIGQSQMPIHPITVSAYYSLGCVEYEMGHLEVAKAYLDKARAIAELRSPGRDDGPIARILWKTAVVLESDTFGSFAREAAELRAKADVAQQNLIASGEGGLIPFIDEDDNDRNAEEDSFDALVPLFYR